MPFCVRCGEPVTMSFCARCGQPVSSASDPFSGSQPGGVSFLHVPGNGAGGATSFHASAGRPGLSREALIGAVMGLTATSESYDCVVCENEERDFTKTLRQTRSFGDEDDDRCGECTEPIPKDAEYYSCRTSWTTYHKESVRYHNCHRKVCQACIDRSRDIREHSRYNHNEPVWKTSLLGCTDDCRTSMCAMCAYYDIMLAGTTCFKPVTEDITATTDGGLWWCVAVPLVGVISGGYPLMLVLDLLSITPVFIYQQQGYMKKRFGLEPASCAEIFFCRWCVVARAYREASLRGYPQHFCCGSRRERRPNMVGPPAGVPRSLAQAPTAAAIY